MLPITFPTTRSDWGHRPRWTDANHSMSQSKFAWMTLAASSAFTGTLVYFVHWQQFEQRKVLAPAHGKGR